MKTLHVILICLTVIVSTLILARPKNEATNPKPPPATVSPIQVQVEAAPWENDPVIDPVEYAQWQQDYLIASVPANRIRRQREQCILRGQQEIEQMNRQIESMRQQIEIEAIRVVHAPSMQLPQMVTIHHEFPWWMMPE